MTQAEKIVEVAADAIKRPCILSGEIRSAGTLCDVISFLAHSSWWGEMIVEHGDTLRALYFDEGHVVAAQSTAESERLGAVLVTAGSITREQAEAARAFAKEKGIRFGEALVERGYLSREQLFGLTKKQVEAIFSGIVAVESGRFFFFEGFDDGELSLRHRLSVDGLLLDAIRKMDEKKYFESRIPTKDHVPVRTSLAPTTSDPFGIFDAIDGKRTVGEVAESVGLAEMEVTRALFQHVQAGDVAIRPPRMAAKQMLEVYNEAIVVLLRELEAIGQADEVRAQLAKFVQGGPETFYEDATPEADGTLDVAKTVTKIEAAADAQVAEERLKQWLYDYASYALFLGRPHLERKERAKTPTASDIPRAPRLPSVERVELDDVDGGPIVALDDALRDLPGTSTVRLRKVSVATVPGVDPSRTLRLGRLDVQGMLDARRTRRMHARVVLPDSGARELAPRAVGSPPTAVAPLVGRVMEAPAPRPNLALVVTVVAAACFALGVLATLGLAR